jgi:hypothetical protein
MKKIVLTLLIIACWAQASLGQDHSSTFDDVVSNDEFIGSEVYAGLGTMALLDLIADEDISSHYSELRKLGKITVSVKKISSSKPEEQSNINVFTIKALGNHGGFCGTPYSVGYMVVNSYTLLSCYDGCPNRYEIVEMSDNLGPKKLWD